MNLMPKIFLEYGDNIKESTIYKMIIKDKRYTTNDNYQSPFNVQSKGDISHLHFDMLRGDFHIKPAVYFYGIFSEIRRIRSVNGETMLAFYDVNTFDVIRELKEQNTIHLIDMDMYKGEQNEKFIEDFVNDIGLRTIAFKKDASSGFYKIKFSYGFTDSEIKLYNIIVSGCTTRIHLTYEFITRLSEQAGYKYSCDVGKVLVFDGVDKCGKSSISDAFLYRNSNFNFIKNLRPVPETRNSYAILDKPQDFSFHSLYSVYNLASRSGKSFLLDRGLFTQAIYSKAFRNGTQIDQEKYYLMDKTFSIIQRNVTNVVFIPVEDSAIARCKLSKETGGSDLGLNDRQIADKIEKLILEFNNMSANSRMKTIVFDQNGYNKIQLHNFDRETALLIYKKFKELGIAYLKEEEFEQYKNKIAELLTYYVNL